METGTFRTRKPKNRRAVSPLTALRLWAVAGARCSFPGCNEHLLRDELTLQKAKLGHIAHIVAAEPDGPRGEDPLPLARRNEIENLTLMCMAHHKLVDDLPDLYPADMLRGWKRDHENRIQGLTGIQAGYKTTILRLTGTVGEQKPSIAFDQICTAIHPRYPCDEHGIEISLTQLPEPDDPQFWNLGARLIQERVTHACAPKVGGTVVGHISVFALAPIPFLVHLGNCVGSLKDVELYQRHRDTNDWTWKVEDCAPLRFCPNEVRPDGDSKEVALIISVSGTIHASDLPLAVSRTFPIYAISIEGRVANPMVLRSRRDLQSFRGCYIEMLAGVRRRHPSVELIHLFAAVPAPIAVLCGREVLPKVHPTLAVYDFHRRNGEFRFALRTNEHGR